MAARALIPFLVGMMLLTGCANTLLTKFQDMQCVHNCDSKDPKERQQFEQPVLQTVQMFIGESGCWIVALGFYAYRTFIARRQDAPMLYQPVAQEDENEDTVHRVSTQEAASPILKPLVPNADDRAPLGGWKITMLALPACCDIIGTTLMNAGLLFVAASIYQMIRGALVLFVGLFSVVFLKRKLYAYHWFSLFIVVLGVALVGVAGALFKGDKNPSTETGESLDLVKAAIHVGRAISEQAATPEVFRTILGIFLIASAQIFTATQFCLEEYILERYALEPLKVVAWEGLFGLLVTLLGQLILHFTIGVTKAGHHGYFDAADGYRQMFTNRAIAISSILIMFSIGGFNFFGLSVTRSISATSRSIIDTCRTLFIWLVSLGLGWETFKWLQVVGFGLLVYGTFMFNDLVRPPIKSMIVARHRQNVERSQLLPEEPIEHM